MAFGSEIAFRTPSGLGAVLRAEGAFVRALWHLSSPRASLTSFIVPCTAFARLAERLDCRSATAPRFGVSGGRGATSAGAGVGACALFTGMAVATVAGLALLIRTRGTPSSSTACGRADGHALRPSTRSAAGALEKTAVPEGLTRSLPEARGRRGTGFAFKPYTSLISSIDRGAFEVESSLGASRRSTIPRRTPSRRRIASMLLSCRLVGRSARHLSAAARASWAFCRTELRTASLVPRTCTASMRGVVRGRAAALPKGSWGQTAFMSHRPVRCGGRDVEQKGGLHFCLACNSFRIFMRTAVGACARSPCSRRIAQARSRLAACCPVQDDHAA